ncbi:peptide MFS transporter, partial [bacterium]|nr:peptide MFS transporter [bacterium]
EEKDPRRDGGFTIFYMGINLGAFFSPLICGTLGQKFGWSYGFIAAGFGMIIGQIIFNLGQKYFNGAGMPPEFKGGIEEARLHNKDYMGVFFWFLGVLALVTVAYLIGNATTLKNTMSIAVGLGILIACALSFLVKGNKESKKEEAAPLTTEEWQRIAVIVILAGFVAFFWLGFEQAGGTMTLFAEEHTQREYVWTHIFSGDFTIPASWFQSINPFVICTFAPLVSMLWLKWDNSKYAISIPTKMALGTFLLGLGFVVMYMGYTQTLDGSKVSPMWLIATYFIHTMGELSLSPVGLSMVSKLAPQRFMSIMMGFWFMSSAVANYFAGTLEHMLKSHDINLWFFLIVSSFGTGIVLLCITPILKKWMHGKA